MRQLSSRALVSWLVQKGAHQPELPPPHLQLILEHCLILNSPQQGGDPGWYTHSPHVLHFPSGFPPSLSHLPFVTMSMTWISKTPSRAWKVLSISW